MSPFSKNSPLTAQGSIRPPLRIHPKSKFSANHCRRRAAARFYCAAWGQEKDKWFCCFSVPQNQPQFLCFDFPLARGYPKGARPFWPLRKGGSGGKPIRAGRILPRLVRAARPLRRRKGFPSGAPLLTKCPVGIPCARKGSRCRPSFIRLWGLTVRAKAVIVHQAGDFTQILHFAGNCAYNPAVSCLQKKKLRKHCIECACCVRRVFSAGREARMTRRCLKKRRSGLV